MIIIPRAFRKCPLCKKSGCDSFAPKFGIYNEISGEEGFHAECLKEVFANPQIYGHALVDKAIDLDQRQHNEREQKAALIERQNARMKEAKKRRQLRIKKIT